MRSLEKELPTLIALPQFECPCAKRRTVLGPGLGYLGKTGSRGGGDGVRELPYVPTTKRWEKYRIQLLSSGSLQRHGTGGRCGRTVVPPHITSWVKPGLVK